MRLIPQSLQARTAAVIALTFFVFLTLFFVTTYFSIRNSLLQRSDGEVRTELNEIASRLQARPSEEEISHILAERRSIGESQLNYILIERKSDSFIMHTAITGVVLPPDVVHRVE